jgi:hypothetical protein
MDEHRRFEVGANGGHADQDREAVDNPVQGDVRTEAVTSVNPGAVRAGGDRSRIKNGATDPDSLPRRSGGSANDPHGGHDRAGRELRRPDPDPIHELVPGGQGAEAPPYSAEELATKMTAIARNQPLVAADADKTAILQGNPDIAPAPEQIPPAVDPTSNLGVRREGIYEATDDPAETGTSPDDGSYPGTMSLQPTQSSAFTGAQKPNLPDAGQIEPQGPDFAQGSGRLQEPVERRANNLVFEPKAGNFVVNEEMQAEGVSSQDKE